MYDWFAGQVSLMLSSATSDVLAWRIGGRPTVRTRRMSMRTAAMLIVVVAPALSVILWPRSMVRVRRTRRTRSICAHCVSCMYPVRVSHQGAGVSSTLTVLVYS